MFSDLLDAHEFLSSLKSEIWHLYERKNILNERKNAFLYAHNEELEKLEDCLTNCFSKLTIAKMTVLQLDPKY